MAASAARWPTTSCPPWKSSSARADPPDHIVIETSGLALPQPLVRAFNWPEVRSRVTVDGVVAVVDGPALAQGRFAADEAAVAAQRAADPSLDHDDPIEELFEDQLACADLVLLNKSDALEEAQVSALAADARAAFAPRYAPARHPLRPDRRESAAGAHGGGRNDIANRPSHHELEGEAEHDHDDFESFVVPVAEMADRAAVLPGSPARSNARDLAAQGLPGARRVAVTAGGAGRGPAHRNLFRPAVDPRRARAGALVVIGLTGLDRRPSPPRSPADAEAMHLLAAQTGVIDGGAEAVDLGQSPGDIVVISAADSELASLAHAHDRLPEPKPSLRLANLMALGHNLSVDTYIERTVQHARFIAVRLLGGVSYWPYGVERLTALAAERNIPLALLPGGQEADPDLVRRSGSMPRGGAPEGLSRPRRAGERRPLPALCRLADRHADEPPPPEPFPKAGLYWPGLGQPSLRDVMAQWPQGRPVAAITFYRSLIEGGLTAPVDALVEALSGRGLNPLPVFVSSLKDASPRRCWPNALPPRRRPSSSMPPALPSRRARARKGRTRCAPATARSCRWCFPARAKRPGAPIPRAWARVISP
jgi:hypothetical protein